MTKRKTHEEFIDEFYNMCQSIEVLGTYKSTNTPMLFPPSLILMKLLAPVSINS